MVADKFALDKYIIKRKFPASFIVFSEAGQRLFQAVKTIGRKKISIYDYRSLNVPHISLSWKLKKSLTVIKYTYNIVDRAHSLLASLECEKLPAFSINFTIKDIYGQQIGLIQPDQVDYTYQCINIVLQNKRLGVFYKNAHMSASYVLDLSADKEKILDRKLALAIAVILASHSLLMKKFSGEIDWRQPVSVGDDIYKIKYKTK